MGPAQALLPLEPAPALQQVAFRDRGPSKCCRRLADRWFLSYNSQDSRLAEALEAGLRRKDPSAAIFFAPKNLRPGAYWMPSLAKGIAESTAFVLLVG